MKFSLRSRIYLGILPLLLLFLGLMYFLVLDVRGLYEDSQEIAYTNLEIGKKLGEIQATLVAMEVLLDQGEDYQPRARDRVTLNRLSVQIGQNSEGLNMPVLESKLHELMFDAEHYDLNLRRIQELSDLLAEGGGNPEELYSIIKEVNGWTIQLRRSLDLSLLATQGRIEERTEMVYVVVIGGMFVAIALTLAVSTILWRRIIRPIEAIYEGLEQYDSDSERLEIDYKENDELGKLARSVEGMTARLKEYQELTNQKLIRSTSALRSILDHSPDAFFILSDAFVPIYSSPSAQRMFEQSALKDAFPSVAQEKFRVALETHEPQLSKELKDAIRLNVAGEEKWYLLHAFPIDAPDADDFSYQHEHSADSVAAIFQEVTLLKLSDSLRKNLLATVSHELKTPITSARMSLYLLLEQQLGKLNEDQVELVETARDDVNRQLATIEHLLDLSRIEEKIDALELTEFTVSSLVEESMQAHTELAHSYEVSLQYTPPESPIVLRADKEKLRIALNNFVVNAIKYSGAGNCVRIAVQSSEARCRVEVIDSGPGMDEATVRSIFDAYTRGNDSGAIKGTGLGLKISKDIIDSHGGEIGCQSSPGKGTTFFFELPLE